MSDEIKQDSALENQQKETVTVEKKKSVLSKVLLAVLLLLTGITVAVYLGIAYYFSNRFLPDTVINDTAFGGKTLQEAEQLLNEKILSAYELALQDQDGNNLVSFTAKDINLSVDSKDVLEEIKEKQNGFLWIMHLSKSDLQRYDAVCTVEFDIEKVEEVLETAGLFIVENATESENAYIGEYISATGEYELIPEKTGTLLDKELTLKEVEVALNNGDTVLNLANCYEQADITTENPELQEKLKQMNLMVSTQITYDWNGSEEILDGELIHEWISILDDEVVLDHEKVREYVNEKSKAYDTYGRKRKFVTTQGVELTLPSGGYGWKTNRADETEALIQLIMEGTVADREPEYTAQGYVKGKNDIGNSYVEIDMTNQHLYLYIDGQIVLETDFVSGNVSTGNMTPPGVFGITYKTRDAVLRGETYETPVSYWMPFNGNIGMHDASWRRSFGGDIYLTNGSHGCINLPLDKAETIYSYMKQRFPVVAYYY